MNIFLKFCKFAVVQSLFYFIVFTMNYLCILIIKVIYFMALVWLFQLYYYTSRYNLIIHFDKYRSF